MCEALDNLADLYSGVPESDINIEYGNDAVPVAARLTQRGLITVPDFQSIQDESRNQLTQRLDLIEQNIKFQFEVTNKFSQETFTVEIKEIREFQTVLANYNN